MDDIVAALAQIGRNDRKSVALAAE